MMNDDPQVTTAVVDADDEDEAPVLPKPKPGRSKAAKVEAAPAAPARVRIQLEANREIPPTGLMVGDNGRYYLIQPGKPVDVPPGIVEILEQAVAEEPILDPQTLQVIGTQPQMRYPFRRL